MVLACIWRCTGPHGGHAGGVPHGTLRCRSIPDSTCSLATVAELSSSPDFCTQPHLCRCHRRSLAQWCVDIGLLRYEPGQSRDLSSTSSKKQTDHAHSYNNVKRRSMRRRTTRMWAASNHLIGHGHDCCEMSCQRRTDFSKCVSNRRDGQVKRIGFPDVILEVE